MKPRILHLSFLTPEIRREVYNPLDLRHDGDLILRALGELADRIELDVHFVNDEPLLPFPKNGHEYDALIIGGAAYHVDELLNDLENNLWFSVLANEVKTFAEQKPAFGICFGHQLLGYIHDGKVAPMTEMEFETSKIVRLDCHKKHPIFHGMPEEFLAHSSHRDVVTMPVLDGVLAQSCMCHTQALNFKENVYGVQFHPEFIPEVMHTYASRRGKNPKIEPTPHAPLILQNFVRYCVLREEVK
ncbi:MAG: hypothetical protein AAB373_00800 [Patescibacteria group bacterium]